MDLGDKFLKRSIRIVKRMEKGRGVKKFSKKEAITYLKKL
jgi:hypothetical protein